MAAPRWARPTSQGWWDVDDLTGFLRLLSREVHRYDPARNRVAGTVGRSLDRLRSRRPQDKHRDRANIRAHYDLGNDFFSLMLDETMMYSSAWFADADTSLAEASTAKLDRLCRRLDLGPDDHVVEIGTGWGGFAVHAAARHGCRVTTTTISRAQFEYATERVAAAGLASLVDVRHDDYRDLTGTYDKLVSIEMIEAVDWRELDTFFGVCRRLLEPDGLMGLQAIVIPAHRYERAKNTEDFIKAFIFPGGCLPSLEAITRDERPHRPTSPSPRSTTSGCTTRRRCADGGPTSTAAPTSSPPSVSTTGSAACGTSTWRTARPPSTNGRSSVVQCVLSRPGARVTAPR